MGAPLIGVLALQGDVREHVRSLEATGARSGCCVQHTGATPGMSAMVA